MAVDVEAEGDEADNAEVNAGILSLDELGGRIDLDALGKLIREGRGLRIFGYLNVGILRLYFVYQLMLLSVEASPLKVVPIFEGRRILSTVTSGSTGPS